RADNAVRSDQLRSAVGFSRSHVVSANLQHSKEVAVIPGIEYTPERILSIMWRRKWWIVLPAIAIAAGVVQWTRGLTDLYRSDALILVVPQQVPESYVRSTVTASVADRLQSISQQILSRTRLERIIVDLNLYEQERKTGIMEDIVDGMRASIDVQTIRGEA